MNTTRNRIFSIAAVALLALAAVASAADVFRPFRADFNAVNVARPDVDGSLGCTPGDLLIEIQAVGWATQMGVITDFQSHCVHPATGEAYNGLWEFTDHRGDTLFGTYVPTMQPAICAAPPRECPIMLVIGRYTIEGGTGRFANVRPTRDGHATGFSNMATGEGCISLSGRIRFARPERD